MSSQKKPYFGMNIGSASMLLIFVVLCLVSFAALSLVSAGADRRLSARIEERTCAYYEAANTAEEALAAADSELSGLYLASDGKDAYFAAAGHTRSWSIPFNDTQTLCVEIEILYPETSEDTFYRITSWQVSSE